MPASDGVKLRVEEEVRKDEQCDSVPGQDAAGVAPEIDLKVFSRAALSSVNSISDELHRICSRFVHFGYNLF